MTRRTDNTERPGISELFLNIAQELARRSSCPEGARHGCVIAKDKYILATGYGSPAKGVEPCSECWLRKGKLAHGHKDWGDCPSVHAEVNAVATAARLGVPVEDATAYITKKLPCENCYQVLVNARIIEFVDGLGVPHSMNPGEFDWLSEPPAERKSRGYE